MKPWLVITIAIAAAVLGALLLPKALPGVFGGGDRVPGSPGGTPAPDATTEIIRDALSSIEGLLKSKTT